MNILITGAAGYIGSHCNVCFNKHGINTVVLDNLCGGHREAVICGKFINGDFGDKELVKKVIKENQIKAIVHFGGFVEVAESVADPQKYYDNNITKMLALLDATVEGDVKYFVFSSSAATFGDPIYTPIDEKHPQNPINPYGRTKLIGEKILADYERAYGLHSCSFRYFNAAGAAADGTLGESRNHETHLIPLVLKAAKSGRELSVFGNDYDTRDGSCIRDYVHVEDLAEAHYLGLKYIMENNKSDAFNLGTGDGYSVLELIKEAKKVTGLDIPYKIAPRRQGDPAVLVASNQKAKETLGWVPKHSALQDIIQDAWNWENNKKY